MSWVLSSPHKKNQVCLLHLKSSGILSRDKSCTSWVINEALVSNVSIRHVLQASKRVRRAFVARYERYLFPQLGTSTA